MLITDFTIRTKNETQCVLSWTSESEEMYSWIFINGKFAIGPFMVASRDRQMTIPFSQGQIAVIEIHDFDDLEIIPNSCEEMPQIKPLLSWNQRAVGSQLSPGTFGAVDLDGESNEVSMSNCGEAARFRVYHGDFATGDESLVSEVNARQGVSRMEINSPVELDGKNGHWYWFRVESLDKYNNESASDGELVKYFASDLPPVPELTIAKQSNNKYTFTIL
jgi:hypothetical protein